MDHQARKITGSTEVRGVVLILEELEGGSHRLSWKGEAIAGSVEIEGGTDASSKLWSEAINALREDQSRDPVEQPEMAGFDM